MKSLKKEAKDFLQKHVSHGEVNAQERKTLIPMMVAAAENRKLGQDLDDIFAQTIREAHTLMVIERNHRNERDEEADPTVLGERVRMRERTSFVERRHVA